MKKQQQREISLGRYQLGWRMVDVVAAPHESGGWFKCCHEGHDALMCIGLDYTNPHDVIAVLVHEAMELSLADEGCVLKRVDTYVPHATDMPVFVFNHNQHTEVCARVGYFLHGVMPDLLALWKKVRRKG